MLLRNIIFFSGILIIGNLPVNPLRDYYRGWFSWDYFYNLGFSRREIGPDLLRNLFYLPFYKLFGLENFSISILYLSVFLFPIIVFLGTRYILKYETYFSLISSLIFSFNGLIYSTINSLDLGSLISYTFFPLSIFLFIKGVKDKKLLFFIFAFIIAGLSSYTLILEGWIFFLSSLLFIIIYYLFEKDKRIISFYLLLIPFLFLSNPFLFNVSPKILSDIKTYQLILLIGENINLDEVSFLILIILPALAMLGLFESSLDIRYRLYSLFLWFTGIFLITYFPVKVSISSLIALSYAILIPYGLKKFYSLASYIEKIVIEIEDEETGKITKYIFNLLFNLKKHKLNILGVILLFIVSSIMISPILQNIVLGVASPEYSETNHSHIIRMICNSDFSGYRILLLGKSNRSIIYKEFGTYCSCPLILYPSPSDIENNNLSDFLQYILSLNSSLIFDIFRTLGVKYIVVDKDVDYPFTHVLKPYFQDEQLMIFLINNTKERISSYRNIILSHDELPIIQTVYILNMSPIKVPILMFKDLNKIKEYSNRGLIILNDLMFYSLILDQYDVLDSDIPGLDNQTYNYLISHGVIPPHGLLLKRGESYSFTFDSEGKKYEIWAKIVYWKNGGILQLRIDNTSSTIPSFDEKYRIKWVKIGSLYLPSGEHVFSLTGIKDKNLILSFSIIEEEEFKKRKETLVDILKKNKYIIVYDFERMEGTGFIEKKYSNASLGYLAHCKGGYVCSFIKELYIPKGGTYHVYLRLSSIPKKSSIVRIALSKYLLGIHHTLSKQYGLYFIYLGSYNFDEGMHRFELTTKTMEYGVSKDYDILLISPIKLSDIPKLFTNNTGDVYWNALSPIDYKLNIRNNSFIIFSEKFEENWKINDFDHFRIYNIINGYYVTPGNYNLTFSGKKIESYFTTIILGYLYIIAISILTFFAYRKKISVFKKLS
ncbi:MAG: hypothetical protein J7K23_05190 [Thermoproteales archaeon]|nr:hypothetical protein [Thermoproteales archaeon]